MPGRQLASSDLPAPGGPIINRLDMPTLDHVLTVEEWRNGRKWAGSRQSAFGGKSAKAAVQELFLNRSHITYLPGDTPIERCQN